MNYWVYILRCCDDSFYTGCTNNVERRLAVHQKGAGAKYTRSHLPVDLVYFEKLPDHSSALRREIAIKQLSHSEKLRLISQYNIAETHIFENFMGRTYTEDHADPHI